MKKIGIGKAFKMALKTVKEHNIPIRTTSCLRKTRFFSNYKEIEKSIISLPTYIEEFLDHKNDDNELKYCLRGQDAIDDLLGF